MCLSLENWRFKKSIIEWLKVTKFYSGRTIAYAVPFTWIITWKELMWFLVYLVSRIFFFKNYEAPILLFTNNFELVLK